MVTLAAAAAEIMLATAAQVDCLAVAVVAVKEPIQQAVLAAGVAVAVVAKPRAEQAAVPLY